MKKTKRRRGAGFYVSDATIDRARDNVHLPQRAARHARTPGWRPFREGRFRAHLILVHARDRVNAEDGETGLMAVFALLAFAVVIGIPAGLVSAASGDGAGFLGWTLALIAVLCIGLALSARNH